LTISIIPASNPSVFQSIASIATCWSIVCVSSTRQAPTSATLVRSSRSVAMTASAATKMATANAISRGPGP
jgi:hypothetical protein